MRVTLANPPWQFNNPIKLYPLGLASLGAYLRELGRDSLTLVDLNAEIRSAKDIIKESLRIVERTEPEVLGLTCWTVQAPFVVEFVKAHKKAHPEVPIILGGVHASSAAAEILTMSSADMVVHAEGEYTLADLLDCLRAGQPWSDVRGLSWRHEERVMHSEPREFIKDLDSLPFPAYDLLPAMTTYQAMNRKSVISVMASRGCVHHCSFCSGGSMWRYQRWRSPENVLSEIEWLRSRYYAGFIRFEDDDLLCNREWAQRLLGLLAKSPVPFSCLARIDSIQMDTVESLVAAGCVEIYHGVETASPRLWQVLGKGMAKGIDLAGCKNLVKCEIEAGLIPTISGIIGIPGETADEMRATVEFLAELRTFGARTQLWILTPYPDTQIVKTYGDHLVKVDRWKEFSQFDVFSQEARTAYKKLLKKYKSIVPDNLMFANEAGVRATGELFLEARGRLMGVFDFV